MRFDPERTDDANKGLSIIQDMLKPVKAKHPNLSYSDIWTLAGCAAVNFCGGPTVPHKLGRTDFADGKKCPLNGRLPDATKGADHIREVFGRMGFNDQEMVALCGAHTLGRCHVVRSGFDGPWTKNPLRFDNAYFKNLLYLEWQPKKWDGNPQFEDVLTGELMMLPSDMALKTDPKFRVWCEIYAKDEERFFQDFANAFAKLVSLGCPAECNPNKITRRASHSEREEAGLKFRENAMHGSVAMLRKYKDTADVHEAESLSNRTALHKAAFWGHIDAVKFLVDECHLKVNVQDFSGDTPLHDAVRFGHKEIAQFLIAKGADLSKKNQKGQTPSDVGKEYGYPNIAETKM